MDERRRLTKNGQGGRSAISKRAIAHFVPANPASSGGEAAELIGCPCLRQLEALSPAERAPPDYANVFSHSAKAASVHGTGGKLRVVGILLCYDTLNIRSSRASRKKERLEIDIKKTPLREQRRHVLREDKFKHLERQKERENPPVATNKRPPTDPGPRAVETENRQVYFVFGEERSGDQPRERLLYVTLLLRWKASSRKTQFLSAFSTSDLFPRAGTPTADCRRRGTAPCNHPNRQRGS